MIEVFVKVALLLILAINAWMIIRCLFAGMSEFLDIGEFDIDWDDWSDDE